MNADQSQTSSIRKLPMSGGTKIKTQGSLLGLSWACGEAMSTPMHQQKVILMSSSIGPKDLDASIGGVSQARCTSLQRLPETKKDQSNMQINNCNLLKLWQKDLSLKSFFVNERGTKILITHRNTMQEYPYVACQISSYWMGTCQDYVKAKDLILLGSLMIIPRAGLGLPLGSESVSWIKKT